MRNPNRKAYVMTNQKPSENTGNATSVNNPKAPGEVEKVNPTTGGTHSTVQTGHKPAKS